MYQWYVFVWSFLPVKRTRSALVTTTNSPESMCGVYSGRCLPRRMLAMVTARRPTTWSFASITSQRRLTVAGEGPMAELAAVYNEVADRNLHLTGQLSRVRRVVGREGKLTERMESGVSDGAWAKAIDDANELVDDLARPMAEVRETAGVGAGSGAASGPGSRPSAPVTTGPKIGRNDPCWCGSGKKYKKCHGREA